ncbi:MAG: hypothetical protein PHC28_16445 [Flavobacterium sp.]|uniref:hypothetical protein n=1 Tax=Flavobacterium sp. TaxID=239 RepID=UPI0026097034|nr:hypothetical protein [Flavobacterium sp.]MDD5152042.1 hypothetical protein [Flavobacterium sp.]
MITRINVLIDVNLKFLYNSKGNSLNLKDFKDDVGNKFQDAETFARIMQRKELITPNQNNEFCYKLTEIGKKIYENGGWLKHLENQKEAKNKIVKIEPKKIVFYLLIIVFIFIIILLLTKSNWGH